MRTLEFKVDKQRLTKDGDFDHIVAGSKGYLRASFMFSEDWNNCLKVASFYDDHRNEYARPIIDGACDIPDEVTDGKIFRLRVIGKRGTDYQLTTNVLLIEQGVR